MKEMQKGTYLSILKLNNRRLGFKGTCLNQKKVFALMGETLQKNLTFQ